jgi:hypothetical protein
MDPYRQGTWDLRRGCCSVGTTFSLRMPDRDPPGVWSTENSNEKAIDPGCGDERGLNPKMGAHPSGRNVRVCNFGN